MDKVEAKAPENTPVSLETMLGSGTEFEAQSKKYTILPVKVKEILQLKKDILYTRDELQGLNFLLEDNFKKLDAWLQKKVLDSNGEPMSISKIANDDWDTDDIAECLRKLYKISG